VLQKIVIGAIWLIALQLLYAQDECTDSCKVNSNLAMMLNLPVKSTAEVMAAGWGATGGVGYNFSSRNAVVAEFLWNRMYPSAGTLQPLQATSSQLGKLDGNSNLYALTGNYRYEFRGRPLGTYLIGGSGWYYRKNWLSRDIITGPGTVCTPAWLWWGFACASGMVTPNQRVATTSTNAWGANAGVGVTLGVGEGSYRIYTEARYHYVPTKNVKTQFIAITVGIRY